MSNQSKLYPTPCVIEQINEDLIEFSFDFGNRKKQQTLRVNAQVFRAWLLLDQPLSRDELADQLMAHHHNATLDDCRELIDDLVEQGVFQLKPANSFCQQELHVALIVAQDSERQCELVLWLLKRLAATVIVQRYGAEDDSPESQDFELVVGVETDLDDAFHGLVSTLLVCANAEGFAAQKYSGVLSETPATRIPEHGDLCKRWLALPVGASIDQLNDINKLVKEHGAGYAPERLETRLANLLGLKLPTNSVAKRQRVAATQAPLLTIGMATYDDYDGVYFTLTSLALHHSEVFDQCELLVLDNNPGSVASASLKKLGSTFPNLRYVAYGDRQGTAVRDKLFELATGQWLMCMDSHVLFAPDAIKRLLAFLRSDADANELLQGPLISDYGALAASHLDGQWDAGFYGKWSLDERAKDIDAPAFEIDMQGLGCFVAKRSFWPGFNPQFTGFGGEEGYIHQKYRNLGGRCLCLPFLRWAHRFERPNGPPYSVNWADRINNYLRGFGEVGLDVVAAKNHFKALNQGHLVQLQEQKMEAEQHSPFRYFDAIACINLNHRHDRWQQMQARFERLQIADRIERVPAVHTPENHHIGCALSHRRVIQDAKDRELENILVFEDDALFLSGADTLLSMALDDFDQPWSLMYLGGVYERDLMKFSNGKPRFQSMPKGRYLTCAHAVAYHQSVYDELLALLPASEDAMANWVIEHKAIDQVLHRVENRWVVTPDLSQQKELIWYTKSLQQYQYF